MGFPYANDEVSFHPNKFFIRICAKLLNVVMIFNLHPGYIRKLFF